MKIAYIAHNRFPTEKAHGVQISEMCNAFIRSHHSVALCTMRYFSKNFLLNTIRSQHKLDEKIKLISIALPFLIVLGRVGYGMQILVFTVLSLCYKDIRSADVIMTRDEIIAIVYGLLGKKVIFEVHTHRGQMWWKFLPKTVTIVSISKGLAHVVQKYVGIKHKILISPDGVNLDYFKDLPDKESLRKTLGIPKDSYCIVYTGHLYAWKGIHTLLQALQFLRKNNPNILCYIVGGTEYDQQNLKKIYDEQGINFVGHIDHTKVPQYLRAGDVLVLPNSAQSLISREYTSPLKLFEYLAAGTPIVASDLPSVREIVDESSVYFMEPDSVLSCAEAIMSALRTTPERKAKLDTAQKIIKDYTWDARVHAIMQVL